MIKITTIIPTYNQEQYIDATIASAVEQIGDFSHEILVSSDGSSDNTRKIIMKWACLYPGLIRDISEEFNVGISRNFRRLFTEATGDYTAILEGDDLWTDPEKLSKQLSFLLANPDCSMVFSMIRVRKLPSGQEEFLPRQVNLTKNKLDGRDFLAEPTMNLIANFSSCLLRSSLTKALPERVFRERFNEIAMAFFFELHGPIGFLREPMSIYHQHSSGVWTGSSREAQLKSGLATRQMTLEIADAKYSEAIKRIIEEKYQKPLAALAI